ncbi:hypothetical protein BC831DRAFT_281838 [Entophlyctis helioformis]|nr:hypothetical protein BC831DRAFT_281838 [Entophlyctis helioformis]
MAQGVPVPVNVLASVHGDEVVRVLLGPVLSVPAMLEPVVVVADVLDRPAAACEPVSHLAIFVAIHVVARQWRRGQPDDEIPRQDVHHARHGRIGERVRELVGQLPANVHVGMLVGRVPAQTIEVDGQPWQVHKRVVVALGHKVVCAASASRRHVATVLNDMYVLPSFMFSSMSRTTMSLWIACSRRRLAIWRCWMAGSFSSTLGRPMMNSRSTVETGREKP